MQALGDTECNGVCVLCVKSKIERWNLTVRTSSAGTEEYD